MRIGINGLLLSTESGYRQSGIDRYVRGLLSALPEALIDACSDRCEISSPDRVEIQDSDNTLIVYAAESTIEPHGRFALHAAPSYTGNRAMRIAWEQAGLPRAIRDDKLDLFHGTAFALPNRLAVPSVVTIHDLAFMKWPEQVPKRRGFYLSRAVRNATRSAARIIAVSESTKRDAVALLQIDPDRIDVTPLGVDARFRRPPGEEIVAFRQRNALHRPFVLAVGTREPRKNLPALIRAFGQIADSVPHELVHAGGSGWLTGEIDLAIKEAALGDRLRFVDFVPHEELPLWYSAADCFVMPSLYEGFGLPLLEAMACGTPALATNRSSLPEVGGDAAIYCEPDVDAIASALGTLLHDAEVRHALHCAGPIRAASFTWQRTAALTVVSYRRGLGDA